MHLRVRLISLSNTLIVYGSLRSLAIPQSADKKMTSFYIYLLVELTHFNCLWNTRNSSNWDEKVSIFDSWLKFSFSFIIFRNKVRLGKTISIWIMHGFGKVLSSLVIDVDFKRDKLFLRGHSIEFQLLMQ